MARPQPPVIEPGTLGTAGQPGRPPSDAQVLFDGRDLSQWATMEGEQARWIVRDGYMESVKGSGYIRTLQNFGDAQLHVEWAAPARVEGSGQGRGNSGVFLMSKYEVQVLDSYHNTTYADGHVAAVYGQCPPLVIASRPPGEWQIFEIVFRRPRFDAAGQVVSPARVTVFHNGVLVQNDVALTGPTDWMQRPPYRAHADKLPLALQDHGNPVRYRNVWVRELEPGPKEFTYATNLLDRWVGVYDVHPDFTITIERSEDQLVAKTRIPRREAVFPLYAASTNDFFMKTVDARISFDGGGPSGPATATLHIGGDQQVGRRRAATSGSGSR